MQKLKKSLKNNILKIGLKQSSNFLNIEHTLNTSVSCGDYSTNILTIRFSKQIEFFKLLGTFKLKYPLVIKKFKDHLALEKYLSKIKIEKKLDTVILTKLNSNIFKNDDYFVFANNSARWFFFQIKSFLFVLSNLLKFFISL
jgi:hypothetical protein